MKQVHDVVIVGSGASGAVVAHELTRLGASCVMLEAGPVLIPGRDITRKELWELPYRGFGNALRQRHTPQASEFDANIYVNDERHPYTYPQGAPYKWSRIRALGGKTMVWGRVCFRMSDYDFRARDHDGQGENWPLRLADLDPYYCRIEQLLRVQGRRERLAQLPDGEFLEDPREDTAAVEQLAAAARRHNLPVTRLRTAQGPLASSLNLLLPQALASGRLSLVTNAIARQISLDRDTGLANGVFFVDRASGRDYHVAARVVILAASCLESTRILLLSETGNSSGVLGHYLFDHFYVDGAVTGLAPVPQVRRDGGVNPTLYIPRFRNLEQRHPDYLRGYALVFDSGLAPKPSHWRSHGACLAERLAAADGAAFRILTAGEALPDKRNHVRLNPHLSDAWGMPVLHIEQRYGENERAMARDATQVAQEMCRDAGFEIVSARCEMEAPGTAVHEMGTCRMGSDPRSSVLNAYNQVHDVPNVLVVDGSAFPSGGTQNPTLTIMALALRAAEHLAETMRTGDGIRRPASFEVAGRAILAEPSGEPPDAAQSGEGLLAQLLPPVACTPAGAVASGLAAFLDREQFRSLRALAGLLFPGGSEVAELLDNILAVSLASTQSVYREGLAYLDEQAQIREGMRFADLPAHAAEELLSTMEVDGADHRVGEFLRQAKDDVYRALSNSQVKEGSPAHFYCEVLD